MYIPKIPKLQSHYDEQIQQHIDNKTKPVGALGQLEKIAFKLAKIQSNKADQFQQKISINSPALFVFAADHGIAARGVSIAPQQVTQQMVQNFVDGGAAINVFCQQLGWKLGLVDAGMLAPNPSTQIIDARLGNGTNDFSCAEAMSNEQLNLGFELGRNIILTHASNADVIAFGEMGIGNTSSASALLSALTNMEVEKCVGRGTGITDEILLLKRTLIAEAIALHKNKLSTVEDVLKALGGFEIVEMCAAMLTAAELQKLVIVDGFICSVAAMVAKLLSPNVGDYLLFSHESEELAHKRILSWFNESAVLNLGMRLGEGSGAALSLPLIQASAEFYNKMASFAAANVEDVR